MLDSVVFSVLFFPKFLHANISSCARHHVSAPILLFQQVDELISRIQGALPSVPLVGGVTQPNAWGVNPWGAQRSLRGAVFLNQRTYDEGAVGCFMQGPLKVPSCA